MEEADMKPGRPQQLPYASPPDKKKRLRKNLVVTLLLNGCLK